jgi:hypothetical protein
MWAYCQQIDAAGPRQTDQDWTRVETNQILKKRHLALVDQWPNFGGLGNVPLLGGEKRHSTCDELQRLRDGLKFGVLGAGGRTLQALPTAH